MADDDKEIELSPGEVALVRALAFIDHENDPVAVIIIGGFTYARMETSLESAMDTTQRVIAALLRFQSSPTVRITDLSSHPKPHDPSKDN